MSDHLSGDDLSREVGEALLRRGWSVALAESCTGGLVAKRLTDVPGSSRYLKGGVVTYADEAKVDLLGVPPGSIREHGAVSEVVAREMAAGAAQVLGADVALAVTGIAGPEGAVPGKPVGTVWFALTLPSERTSVRAHFEGDRAAVREAAAEYGLNLLLREVSGTSVPADPAENPERVHG